MKLTPEERASRIARITRDVRREAYPPASDPREPLFIGNVRPRSPILVMRADFVALAEELAETDFLRAQVAALTSRAEKAEARVAELESLLRRCLPSVQFASLLPLADEINRALGEALAILERKP